MSFLETAAPLGMPAARPFSLEIADSAPLFMVPLRSFWSWGHRTIAKSGIDLGNYGEFENASVLGFTHAEMEELLKRTGMIMSERYGSTKKSVEWAVLAPKPDLPGDVAKLFTDEAMLVHPFQVAHFEGDGKNTFSYLVSRMLGPVVGRKIIFGTPNLYSHSRYHPYDNRGGFQVYVWSTPDENDVRTYYGPHQRIWGNVVDDDGGGNAFQMSSPRSDAGVLIKDGDYAVAELLENALYIYHNLAYRCTPDALRIMARVLQEAAKYLREPEMFAGELRKIREAYFAQQKEAFEALVQRAIPNRAERRSDDIAVVKGKIARLRKEYFEAERTLFGLQHAAIDPAIVAERFRSEIAKLQEGKVALVERVEFRTMGEMPQIHAYTLELSATDPDDGRVYLLGRYRIVLNLAYEENDANPILMFNLDRQPGGFHHPHVDEDGVPCLGNLDEQLPEYIAHFEIEAAITLAIAFLQTVNPEDNGYVDISRFSSGEDEGEEDDR